jgi:hypothetical protein
MNRGVKTTSASPMSENQEVALGGLPPKEIINPGILVVLRVSQ